MKRDVVCILHAMLSNETWCHRRVDVHEEFVFQSLDIALQIVLQGSSHALCPTCVERVVIELRKETAP
jgi:hypothetical protein